MDNKAKTVALHTLGCKVNAYETEGMQQILSQNGFRIVPFDTKADIYIINTCSVTNIADHKSRQMLHKAKKTNPEAVIIACGCYVQTGRENLEADPDVDILVGNNEKKNIAEVISDYYRAVESQGRSDGADFISDTSDQSSSKTKISRIDNMDESLPYEEMRLDSYRTRTRGFVKIQDGCNRFCTYCVIPYARGRVRSRQIPDIIAETEALVGSGCTEIVLTGIHISSFGTDRGETELLKLLIELNKIDGLNRIRLGSLEPAYVTAEWIAGVSEVDKLCPHFHLSLQSGSESVLKRMNRHYTPEEYFEAVCRIRDAYDAPAITTDVIVGFPGETPEEYEESFEFVRKVGFYELHVFKYSRRDGTVAARLPGQITEKIKNERSAKMIALGDTMSAEYRRSRLGSQATVIPEEYKTINGEEYLCGFTPEYICAAIPKKAADSYRVSGTGTDKSSFGQIAGILTKMLTDDIVLLSRV